jgi:hypothetical protein
MGVVADWLFSSDEKLRLTSSDRMGTEKKCQKSEEGEKELFVT